jgi:hypothetical protein
MHLISRRTIFLLFGLKNRPMSPTSYEYRVAVPAASLEASVLSPNDSWQGAAGSSRPTEG